ncbi:MAG: hypothetical protein WBW06_02950 [Xanthobacteraceae bacterium]|jgi:hypothetical protein
MSAQSIIAGVIDKIVIGTIATVVSLLVLHGYNTHLKALEGAEPQAKSMSDLALKKKNELLSSIKGLVSIANGLVYRLPEATTNQDPKIRTNIADISTSRRMLGSSFLQTTQCFGGVEDSFEAKIHGNYDAGSNTLNLPENAFQSFIVTITAEQDKCIELFNKELAVLLARQYTEIYAAFYQTASWYERPDTLLVAALVCAGVAMAGSLALSSLRPSQNGGD